MIQITTREGTFPTAPRPVILRVVRCDDPVVVPRRGSRRPVWSLLYAIVFLAFAVLLASDFLLPEGLAPPRRVAGGFRRHWADTPVDRREPQKLGAHRGRATRTSGAGGGHLVSS